MNWNQINTIPKNRLVFRWHRDFDYPIVVRYSEFKHKLGDCWEGEYSGVYLENDFLPFWAEIGKKPVQHENVIELY